MTPAHLLSLADLHAAAPGVLDVVFGPDGGFDGAPMWRPMVTVAPDARFPEMLDVRRIKQVDYVADGRIYVTMVDNLSGTSPYTWAGLNAVWLDLRVPSVAVRLLGLCTRAGAPTHFLPPVSAETLIAAVSGQVRSWTAGHLARMTLELAPRIAALRGGR